ncbi:MAG: NAD(P)-dependent oxidoreductase [Bacteroidaceae bacterium]|nr:NAD(P)-dependent oxidoreductase [Bacteroidaceae bacterium]
MNPSRRIVITGATSFIGMELTSALLAAGHNVVAVCRATSAGKLPEHPCLTVVEATMEDYGALVQQIPAADVFIHLAWKGTGHGGRDEQQLQQENVVCSLQALQAAHEMGCQLFVDAGSQAEYGIVETVISETTPCHPFSEYGKAKLRFMEEASRCCQQWGMKYLHFRIFSLFGEDDHPWTLVMTCVQKMLRHEAIDLSACTQHWNFLYVKDAARQMSLLCDYALGSNSFSAETFNIASEDTRVLRDFVLSMQRLTQSNSILHFGAVAPAKVVTLQPEVSKTKAAIGFISSVSFEDVIRRIILKYSNSK